MVYFSTFRPRLLDYLTVAHMPVLLLVVLLLDSGLLDS
jgi:hypothetical protein